MASHEEIPSEKKVPSLKTNILAPEILDGWGFPSDSWDLLGIYGMKLR